MKQKLIQIQTIEVKSPTIKREYKLLMHIEVVLSTDIRSVDKSRQKLELECQMMEFRNGNM